MKTPSFQFAISRLLRTAWLETRLNLWGPAPWIIGLVLALLGYLAVRTAPDASSFPLGWALSHQIGPLAAVPLLLFLAASLAHRPLRYEMTEIQDSKVVGSEELVLGRWIGMLAAIIVPLLVQYGVTIAGQKIHARPAILPLAYLQSLGRLLPPVLFFSTLAFGLVSLTRVLLLGAGLAGLLWLVLQFGQVFYPTVLRMDLSQNGSIYLGLTGVVLLVLLLGSGGRRRAKHARLTYALAVAAGLALTVTCIHVGWAALALPGKETAVRSWERLHDYAAGTKRVTRRGEPIPNFAWVDLDGRRVSFESLRGRPALLVFLEPRNGGLLPLLRRLTRLRVEFPPEKLGLLTIFLTPDLNAARHAAFLAHARTPIVTDWGSPAGSEFDLDDPPSVVSWALGINGTPTAILVGADGKERKRGLALDEENWEDLKRQLDAAIRSRDEPEEEAPESPGLFQGIGAP